MNEVNKTLYIPLYGKAQLSKKGIILQIRTMKMIEFHSPFFLPENRYATEL